MAQSKVGTVKQRPCQHVKQHVGLENNVDFVLPHVFQEKTEQVQDVHHLRVRVARVSLDKSVLGEPQFGQKVVEKSHQTRHRHQFKEPTVENVVYSEQQLVVFLGQIQETVHWLVKYFAEKLGLSERSCEVSFSVSFDALSVETEPLRVGVGLQCAWSRALQKQVDQFQVANVRVATKGTPLV